jgi:hypothetical protein
MAKRRGAVDPVVFEITDRNDIKRRLIKNNSGNVARQGWTTPQYYFKEVRAFRETEQGEACFAFKMDRSRASAINGNLVLTIPFPLLFVPEQWVSDRLVTPVRVERGNISIFLGGKAYTNGRVRIPEWQIVSFPKVFPGTSQGARKNAQGSLEEFCSPPLLQKAFRIAAAKRVIHADYEVDFFYPGSPLASVIIALNNRKLVHKGSTVGELLDGDGADVFCQELSVGTRTVIAIGMELGVSSSGTGAPTIVLQVGSEQIELPVDGQVRVRSYQSPDTVDSPATATDVDWIVEIAGLPAKGFEVFWNTQVARPHYAALATVDGARDLSFVPFFENVQPRSGQGRFSLVWRIRHRDTSKYEFSEFEPARFVGAYPSATGNSFTALAKYPQLKGRREDQFAQDVTVGFGSHTVVEGLYQDLEAGNSSAARRLQLNISALAAAQPDPARDLQVRVGGLDLTLNPTRGFKGHIELDFETLEFTLPLRVPHVAVTIDNAGLSNVVPGGQDPVPDELLARNVFSNEERLAAAGVASAQPAAIALVEDVTRDASVVAVRNRMMPAGEFILGAEETTASDRSRNIVLRLRHLSVVSPHIAPARRKKRLDGKAPLFGADALRAIIIDTEPFQIAKVVLPDLLDGLSLGDDVDGEFAIYRVSEREGQGWSLSGLGIGFDLYLPPQGIGEAMEKGHPWPDISKNGRGGDVTIDYRLSPVARFRMEENEISRRYAEAPWNLRRRFGDAGQRMPGSQFAGLRAELLYGLSMHLRGDNLRLAEVGAFIGALRENLAPIEVVPSASDPAKVRADIHKQFRRRWANLRKVYQTRLAVLEPWRLGTQGRFAAEQGIDHLLRIPGIQGIAADLRDPMDTRVDAPGLAGGAVRGFESNKVYQETVENPRSTGGRIANLAFTALGGSGSFTAEFAKGKTRIVADVAIGRTQRYAVERLGRIGLVWNHAKHVIVYERTVLPSDQFSQQGVWDRSMFRPVLRKVEEYVELLQPLRKFAEGDAPAIRRGMAEAAVFKTVRIAVDGRNWGRDVPEGWVVPLWRPDAEQRLYPKPQAAIRLTATKDSAESSLDAECTRPERLMFFTSTRSEDGADTDRWAPVHAIDYVNVVRPQSLFAKAEPTDQQQPDDLIEDPLFAAVTIPISTAGQQVSLGEGRVGDGLGAVLESLTFMRAAPAFAPDGPQARAFAKVADARRSLADAQRALDTLSSRLERVVRNLITVGGGWKPALKREIESEAGAIRGLVVQTSTRARDNIAGLGSGDAWIQSGAEALKLEVRSLSDRGTLILTDIREAVDRAYRQGELAIVEAEADWLRGKDRAGREVGSLFLAAHALLRSPWPLLDDVFALEKEFAVLPDKISAAVAAESVRLQSVVAHLTLGSDLEAAKRIAREATLQFERRALDFIDQIATSIERVPAVYNLVGRERAEAYLDRLRADVDRLAKDGRSAIAAAADNANILGQLQALVANLAATLTVAEQQVLRPVIRQFSVGIDAAKNAVRLADNVLDDLAGWQNTVKNDIKGMIQAIGNAPDAGAAKDALKAGHDAIRKVVDDIDRGLKLASEAIIKNFLVVVGPVLGGLSGTFDATKQDIADQIDAFEIAALSAIASTKDWALSLVDQLDEAAQPLEEALTSIASRSAAFCRDALGITKELERSVTESVGRLAVVPTFQHPESTLSLIRAAGQSPLVPNFKFNRERIAYIFDDFSEAVRTSPMAGLVNRVGDDLKALGLRIPTEALAERIIPAELQNFDISKIFPDLAGFKLDGLFRNIKLPRIAQDSVKVTHGFDRASQTAWAKATSDVPLGGPSDILSFGPLRLTLSGGRFTALADIVASIQGPPRTKANAEIIADWQLAFGGVTLVTFERTRAAFDDARGLTIDISPDRIRFDRAIQFLSDLIKSFGDPDSGFVLELEVDERNRPIGVRAGLDLPLPPIAAGAFAASGLRVAASAALTVSERRGVKNQFAVECAASIGRPDEPFTLMVAFLNGGGYLTARALYVPQLNLLEARVAIAIVAGVGADFAFGPARGSVYLQFGAEAAFITPGSGLSVEAFILIRGGVVILGLITIGLVMRLGITYQNGSVDARGYLRVEIKVSIFFKIRTQVNVHYHLAGKSPSSFRAAIANDTPHYLDLFA